ncbi:MAG: hypothetical protein ACRD43_03205, partial [Pyrinomonadaceae bacterium]
QGKNGGGQCQTAEFRHISHLLNLDFRRDGKAVNFSMVNIIKFFTAPAKITLGKSVIERQRQSRSSALRIFRTKQVNRPEISYNSCTAI